MTHDPLILTLALHPEDQARFQHLRQTHFPPALNLVPAHITLFHHLPGAEQPAIQQMLALACSRQAPFDLAVTGLRSLGRGVAFTLEAPALAALRQALARPFHGALTPQDRQPYKPHLTIQNKVPPPEARTLLDHMRAGFTPFTARAEGLTLWHYRGGPWHPAWQGSFTGQCSKT